VDAEDDLGPRDVEQVGVAGDVARVVAEPLAAVRLLALDLTLDQDALGAVENGDSPPEQVLQLFDPFAHKRSLPKEDSGAWAPAL
jgi:hypothetical protein